MQGRMNGNLERKGPHKSMHCKFCKPPGVVVEDKSTYPQLETKTKVHLVHEGADLTLFDVHDEPGMPAVEHEACVCVLEGDKSCPKCVPDKNRPPQKKRVCRCPKGAKPHPSMFDETPVQKKEEEQDDEFWWEKYSREHDAMTRETWAAYMAYRKKEKKANKCQKSKEHAMMGNRQRSRPLWFQKLSCQQILYIEHLSTAVRLDSDENVTDRTNFVLGAIGLYPRPSRKILKKCLTYCQYNTLHFLNQLLVIMRGVDPFFEKPPDPTKESYTWNEILIMSTICHLELPAVLRELMDRLPPLPRDEIPPQIPYPVFPKQKKVKYETPYDEPLWKDSLTWYDKERIDRINRVRAHLETKRAKIPALALVRRPSLIDNRPAFLAQIEANERASWRLTKEKQSKPSRPANVSTFNSAVDVTAIAGIAASDVSTTDKTDTEDMCVFLRETKRPPMMVEEDHGEEEFIEEKEVKFEKEQEENTQVKHIARLGTPKGSSAEEDIPFKTPPKRESGTTIASPCPPPDGTPGPPVNHYERAKREVDIMKKDICAFYPMVSSSTQTFVEGSTFVEENIEEKLKSAAEILKQYVAEPKEEEEAKKKDKKKKKGQKRRKSKTPKVKLIKIPLHTARGEEEPEIVEEEEEEEEEEGVDEEESEEEEEIVEEEQIPEEVTEEEEEVEEIKSYRVKSIKSRKPSVISDPDPDPDGEWPPRPICVIKEEEEEEKAKKKSKCKKKKCKLKKKMQKKTKKDKRREKLEAINMVLREESEEYLKKPIPVHKQDRVTMTECYPGEYDYLYSEDKEAREFEKKKPEKEVYMGDPNVLVDSIIKDLAEEGFICAGFSYLRMHEDVKQLIAYLKGKLIDKKTRAEIIAKMKILWNKSKEKDAKNFIIHPLKISNEKMETANWNDKKWVSKLAKEKIDEFYFKEAYIRSQLGKELYLLLHFGFLGNDRYLKAFYAYMVSKYEDCIMKGV